MTCDAQGVVNIVSKFMSLALTIQDLWYVEDKEEKDEFLNEIINH